MSTLFDLNEHLRRIVALNFPQPWWVSAEVAQIGESKGHMYLELVQKDPGGDIVAQAQAVIWSKEYRQMSVRLGLTLQSILREGLELKMLVRPEFHERYGLKLHIIEIDPAYTLGQLDLQRRQTIEQLRKAGLMNLNRSLRVPIVLQRLAVISSETAAGLQDFRKHLEENVLGYRFDLQLFKSTVQGKSSEKELVAALERIAAKMERFDAVIIVRGGGSRLDLSAFDGLELCMAVARLPLPVFTGIGHDVDETVLDMVAHRSLKTPTAVAEFILQYNSRFEGAVLESTRDIEDASRLILQRSALNLTQAMADIRWAGRQRLQNARIRLDITDGQAPALARQLVHNQYRTLDRSEAYCLAQHPDAVLRRGYSLTFKDGKVVSSASDLVEGDVLETRLRDGRVRSRVSEK